jgi:glycosyltransferase involved in cell wall biosynthesis
MKVGVDARSLLNPSPRGEGRSLRRLYQEIAKQRPDWQLVFYGEGTKAFDAGVARARVDMFDIPGYRFNTWENIGLPLRALRDRVDLLHCSSSTAPRFAPAPIVMTVHDVIPLVFDDGWSEAEVARFRRQLRAGIRTARAIITVSRHTRDELVRLFPIDQRRIRVVHWGIDSSTAPARDRAEVAKRLSCPALTGPYFVTFGGDARRKNASVTLEAFAIACARAADIRLAVVGLGNAKARERYQTAVQALGIADRVVLLGYLSDEDLDDLYAHAHGLLYLSLYEGFGLPVLEAMAKGAPVVASNTTSIPEVAGDAAALVDPTDRQEIAAAVCDLVADSQRRAQMSANGRRRASEFSWSVTASSTIEVLEGAAPGDTRRPTA